MRRVATRLWGKMPLAVAAGVALWQGMQPEKRYFNIHGFSQEIPAVGEYRQGFPEYSRAEVAQHKTPANRIWITYKNGVYDVTDFLPQHPGGQKLMMAAGAAADPFWNLYQVHQRSEVFQMLESMRVGNLKPSEKPILLDDPYSTDPERHPAIAPLSAKPFNGEAPHQALLDGLVTPNDIFFVRNHLPVPDIDGEKYKLEIIGIGVAPVTLSLTHLKSAYKHHKVTVTTQCSGNRRAGMATVAPVKGLMWDVGAVSTAEWTGVLLRDVLQHAGFVPSMHPEAHHVRFQGYDHDPGGAYEASIPLSRAMNPYDEVLLAFEMNGEPLPRDHGFPIRVIIPGVAGVRNVKWLKRIEIAAKESESVWQKRDYRVFPASVALGNVDYDSAPPIQEMPVNSAILSHKDGDEVSGDTVELGGYAISGGGHGIHRVEVTTSDGEEWSSADLKHLPTTGKTWAWTHWRASIPVASDEVKACVRAYDSSYNTQPRTVGEIWNFRGLLNNSWHCVKLHRAKSGQ